MKRLRRIIAESFMELLYSIKFIVESNLYNVSVILELMIPYIMMYMVLNDKEINYITLIWPMILFTISYMLKRIAVKSNKGYDVPVPFERFTKDEGDGEITVDQNRLQEMILYVADIEDYLTKKGRL